MKLVLVIAFTFGLWSTALEAQVESTKDKTAFVEVYMASKKANQNLRLTDEFLIDSLQSTYNITRLRYLEIFVSTLQDLPIKLSPQEEAFMKAVRSSDEAREKKSETITNDLCTEHQISTETYARIHQLYKTDIKFQRTLKPYFDTYRAKR